MTTLVSKDFKLKYRRSVLGVAWSVLNPLLMMVALSLIFSHFFRFQIENFPLYLILGNTLFDYVSRSTNYGMLSIIDAAPLIKKIRVNKAIFPLEKVLFELLSFAISLIAVALVLIFFQIIPTANILFLPLLMLYVTLFASGLSFALAAFAVYFRDLVYLWGVVVLVWMYATPIFWPIDMLPDYMQTVIQFNPMFHFVTYFRQIVLWGDTPSLFSNLICLGMGLATFAAGYLIFRKLQRRFILHV